MILETDMRNRLLDLKQKLILVSDRNKNFDREPYERDYFAVMGEANSKWREIKEGQGNA